MSDLTVEDFRDDYEQFLLLHAEGDGRIGVKQAMDIFDRHVLAANNPGELA